MLQRELSQKHMAVLEKSGTRVPDHEMALKWEKEIKMINNYEFNPVNIRRPIPDILFGIDSPTWVVEVSILDDKQEYDYRYFWLSWGGIDIETSKLVWYFSI